MVTLDITRRPARLARAQVHDGQDRIREIDTDAMAAALAEAIDGEVRFEAQARALYATDASNYREVPIGVVIPRSLDDVEKAVAVCRRFDAPITSRGGGTSLAGQCCNTSVVIDFSKYLNRVLELDPEARSAWVEPGCVLDDLRDAASRHGLTFGPDPSTHDHCTLGGMVGNNSCGVHSVMAGRSADNIEALEILTYDGLRMVVGPTGEDELARIVDAGGRRGDVYARLRQIRDDFGDEVRERYPPIPRRVSGFNLDELLPEKGFNVARALVGSEGTCVTVLRIKCRLVPNPQSRVLLVLGYPDVFTAGDAVPRVLEAGPVGLEGVDDQLTRYMHLKHLHEEDLDLLPDGGGWLFAEFGDDTPADAKRKAEHLMEALGRDADAPSMSLIDDPHEQARLWKVREAGLPATAHVPGMGETYPGWEDAAVPPARVGDYLRAFRELTDEFGYHCSLYGHFGDGCIHCRIDFDLTTRSGVETYRRFIDRAADLVLSFGGSISGEHGDGQARGALLEKMFGDRLLSAFRDFKSAWDPAWRMNPGKVVMPASPTESLRKGPDYDPWAPATRLAFRPDQGDFARAADRCVGVGKCRKHATGVMCPSYMATREEAYSTRGRARLLFEMTHGSVIEDGWRSGAVRDALDLCLACKACRDECPVEVDMAAYKTEFMHHHYEGRLRPRAAYSMGLIWWWSRLAGRMPRVANTLAHTAPFSTMAGWLGGFAPQRSIPAFADPSFRRWFAKRGATETRGDGRRVLLWPDTFNSYFTSGPLEAAVALLETAGWRVEIPPRPVCCGRPLYGFGLLGLADRMWQRTIETLRPWIREDVPIVAVEPTCLAAFRDELMEMRPKDRDAQRLAHQVVSLGEFLRDIGFEPPRREGRALLHAHCHQRAVTGVDAERELLSRTGMEVELLDDGCCGMAGDFGFRRETYDVAMEIGELGFLPRLRGAGDAVFIADGFSCREQARQATGRAPVTTAEILCS